MLDDLRKEAASDAFLDEEDAMFDDLEMEAASARPRQPFLGLTASQRFVLALMLLLSVCMLGSLCLLITERVVPPGLY